MRATSISAIAERAGCGRPSVYLRWPHDEAVITAALEDISMTDESREKFAAAAAALDSLSSVPQGRVLVEVLLLPSAVARLKGPPDAHAPER